MSRVKLPNGTLGLIVSSTNEAQQEDLFFPCDPRLFAVNVNGDPECGSLVFDLNAANEPDSARGAYLQSAFRVVKLPLGFPNAIAFQLDYTGQRDTQGGYFCEVMEAPAMEMPAPAGDSGGGAGGPGKTVVQVPGQAAPAAGGFGFGEGSHRYGGPFHVGVVEDKHYHGDDADGNPINALHLWTEANFFKNRIADGPIRFELEYKEGDELDHVVPCHLAWTGADWAIWTTTKWYEPPPPYEDPQRPNRPFGGTIFNGNNPPLDPLRPNTGQPGGEIVPGGQDVSPYTIFNGNNPTFPPAVDGRVTGSGIPMNLVASLSAVMAPAMVMRPENYNTAVQSTGLFDASSPQGGSNSDRQSNASANRAKADASSPITAMASAFGAQGGFVDAGGSGSGTTHGGEGDPWIYTQTPRGNITPGKKMSRYAGGTASGGIIYHPPEVDLRDVDAGMVPDNVTLSETRVMCAPGASFGVGIPDLATGSIKTGANLVYDSDTGDMVIHTYSFTTESEAIRLTNPTQLIRWMSGQSFYGEFSHTNTSNQTWTFPDVTATIAAMIFTVAAPASTAPEGTFAWDIAADNLYVNSDGTTTWQFVGGASSVTGSGANTRVAFWSGTRTLTSDAGFTFDGVTLTLSDSNATTTPLAIFNQASTGDSAIRWSLATSHSYAAGIDNTDDAWKVSYAASGTAALGTNDRFAIATSGFTTFTPGAASSGTAYGLQLTSPIHTGGTNGIWKVLGGASTGQTASTEIKLVDIDLSATITWVAGAITNQRAFAIEAPTLAFASASTVTNAATLYIDRAPQVGLNATITNAYALWVDAGISRFDGSVGIGTTGPDRVLDVLDASSPQLRLTHTDGSAYTDFQTDSGGNMTVATSGTSLSFAKSASGSNLIYLIDNASNTASSQSILRCRVAGSTAGDAYALFSVSGVQDWSFGIDNSDSDKFKISGAGALGSSDYITILPGGSVGINTTGPDRRLDILDGSSPQLRLTQADGSVYVEFEANSSGNLNITPTGSQVSFSKANSGANNILLFENSSNTASSQAIMRGRVGGSSAGDAFFLLSVSGVQDWSVGLDNSDSDKFKISAAGALGSSDYFTLTVGGLCGINQSAPTARFEVVESTAGNEIFRLQTTATNDDPNYRVFQNRVATTDATVTTLQTIAITASNTYQIEARVQARRTGGTAGTAEDAASYVVRGTYKTVAGTVTLVGAVSADYTAEDQAGWDATLTISGTNVLVRVTGALDNNVTWHGTTIVSNLSS